VLDGNNKRRSSRIVVCQVETRVVGWDKKANNRCASNVKHQDAEVYASDGLRQITSWVFRLACSDLVVGLNVTGLIALFGM
jgi:hypothetical protein